jgi:hypothetical protein
MRSAQRPGNLEEGACGYFANGQGNSDWRIITRSDVPTPADAWEANVLLGDQGSGDERGLESVRGALRAPISTGWNAGFLRPDADLAVVHLSDEGDGSPGSVASHVDELLRIRGAHRKNRTSIHAIVGDAPGGCSSADGTAASGARYIEAAGATGGVFHSICTADWARTMNEIGGNIFGGRSRYPLASHPLLGSLIVEIDGVVVPAGPWLFDIATNTIVFDALSVPPPGAEVAVSYAVECL